MALSERENGVERGESGAIVKASVLGAFGEIDETKALISSLPEVHGGTLTRECTTERFLGMTAIRILHQPLNSLKSLDGWFKLVQS